MIYSIDNGAEKTISNLPLGDYTLNLGKLSAGNHTFCVQVYDKTTGKKSHKLYDDLWVQAPSVNVYNMTTTDLSTYNIKNNDSSNATDMENTRNGLNKLFKDKQAQGYNKIVLVKGTYRINGSDTNRAKSIEIPSHFTVDMNQSTFKLNPIMTDIDYVTTQNPASTAASVGALVVFNNVVDAHLTNGTLVGDRNERKAAGLETDPANKAGMGEQINTVVFRGGKYCSLSNLTIKDTTGHTVITQPYWKANIPLKGYTRTAIFAGNNEVNASNCSTSGFTDITAVLKDNQDNSSLFMGENYMFVGNPGGYRGIQGESPIIYVSFYDNNRTYIKTIEGYQYRRILIPSGAKYARVTLLGADFSDSSQVAIYTKKRGDYASFTDLDFIDTRTSALAPATCCHILIDGCTYTRAGNSITPAAVDFEDGVQECQDIFYQNNTVIEKSGTVTLIDNYGFNHIYNNNKNHTYEVRNRVVGGLITGINDQGSEVSTILWKLGDYARAPFGRIMNNNCGMINVTNLLGYDPNGAIYESNSSVPEHVTYKRCTLKQVNASNARLEDCTVSFRNRIGANLYCYNCTFKAMNGDYKFNWVNEANSVKVFDGCEFEGTTVFNDYLSSASFNNCEFDNICIVASAKNNSTTEAIVFEGCTINSTTSDFLKVGPYTFNEGYLNVKFKNCNITHTGTNLVNFHAKPQKGSQIVFDTCTITKQTGKSVTSVNDTHAYDANTYGCSIEFISTPLNGAVTVDTSKIDSSKIIISYKENSRKNGIITENGKLYYYIDDVKQTGWQTIDEKRYYFGEDGAAATGIVVIDGQAYTFEEDGVFVEVVEEPETGDVVAPEGFVYYASYENFIFYRDENGDTRCYDATTLEDVYNTFKCDGTYTYYFQYDRTAMRDRLTYHPDGEHIIYFDKDGHEVFSDYGHITTSIAGDTVDDYCFFDVYGYMYVDVLTYDITGTKIYYANPYGVLEHNGWFTFSDGGYGYANGDMSLMTNQYTYDWNGNYVYMEADGHIRGTGDGRNLWKDISL